MARPARFAPILAALCLSAAVSYAGSAAADFGTHPKAPGTMPGDTLIAGSEHTCIVESDGELWCWGYNGYGQLGDGSQNNTDKPYAIGPALTNVVSAAGGGAHTCAIKRDGSLWCWGYNGQGQVGIGDPNVESVLKPVEVIPSATPVRIVSLGMFTSCAVYYTGHVACWGANDVGQLGVGHVSLDEAEPYPQSPDESHDIINLSLGFSHGCAVRADGTAWCWGSDSWGQLGNGLPFANEDEPSQVSGVSHAIAISAGTQHSCAIERPGTMKCWGRNEEGQLGDGTNEWKVEPVQVVDLPSPATSMNASWESTCVRVASGKLYCWGNNASGELGQGPGDFDNRNRPVLVPDFAGVAQPSVGGVAWHNCASLANGEVWCWGPGGSGQIGNGASNLVNPQPVLLKLEEGVTTGFDLGGGSAHSCAMLKGGCVKCWGSNSRGQLGNGTTDDSLTPAAASGLGDVVSLAATGQEHNCALRADGTAWCWGDNTWGQLGGGSAGDWSSLPVQVPGLPELVAIASGGWHSCAITAGLGEVYCWGANDAGQLGNDSVGDEPLPPVRVLESPSKLKLTGAVMVQAGQAHSCALLSGGAIKCWGDNAFGQLGNGTQVPSALADFVFFPGGGRAHTLAAGGWHNCMLRTDGSLHCWGQNAYGQLGDGSTTPSLLPKHVVDAGGAPVPPPVNLALGLGHTCAGFLPGGLRCWGHNTYGQIDGGHTNDSPFPASVPIAGLFQFNAKYLGLGERHSLGMPMPPMLGYVLAWGHNEQGQLGDGTTTDWPAPASVKSATCLTSAQAQEEPPPEFKGSFFTYGPELGQWEHPFAVAVDDVPQGQVFVSDTHAVRICRLEADGTGPLCWGSQCNLYDGYVGFPPGYGCVDPDGDGPLELGDGQCAKYAHGPDEWALGFDPVAQRLYVDDNHNCRVQAFAPDGTFLFKFGSRGTEPGQFRCEMDLAVDDRNGRVVVLDTRSHRVQVFSDPEHNPVPELVFGSRCDLYGRYYPGGDPSCQVHPETGELGDGQFYEPGGAAVDGQGRIWVVDTVNWRVQVFDEAGQFLFKLGEHGTGPGKFEYPVGIGIDGAGYAYVADASNGVQKFDPSGRCVTELPMAVYAYGVAVNRATGTTYVGLRDRISMFRPLARSVVDPATGLEARATGDVASVTLHMSEPEATVTAGAQGGEVAVRFIVPTAELDQSLCPSWCSIAENGIGLPTSRVEGSIIYFARTRFAPGETRTFTLTTDVTLCHFPPGNRANFHTLVVEPNAAEAHQRQHGDLLYLRCPEGIPVEPGAGKGKKSK